MSGLNADGDGEDDEADETHEQADTENDEPKCELDERNSIPVDINYGQS